MLRRQLRNHRKQRSPTVESLERRAMMAANLSAVFDGSTLRIEGTNGNDQIIVREKNNQITVDNATIRYGNSNCASIAAASVKAITVDGLAGDDVILLNSEAFAGQQAIIAMSTIHGGAGNDQIAGTAVRDYIYGDDGNDQIWGGDGEDYLSGGNGDDYLCGNNSSDNFAQLEPGFDRYCDDFNFSRPVVNGIQATDVQQRELGVCVTAAALAEGASQGFDFSRMIVYQGNHNYDVTVYKSGTPTVVRVYFDGTYTDNDPSACNVSGQTQQEFWPILMQRARLQMLGIDASVYNNYISPSLLNSLNAKTFSHLCDVQYALSEFRGIKSTNYFTSSSPGPAVLQAALQRGAWIGVGTKSASNIDPKSGIVDTHTYAVRSVYQYGGQWWVALYNPWGMDGRNGALDAANDGNLTVSWSTFQRNGLNFSIAG